MSIITSEFPLIFPNHRTHLNKNELNNAYGEKGKTFPSILEAHSFLVSYGFTATSNPRLWKDINTNRRAYISNLRKSVIKKISNIAYDNLCCDIEIYDIDGYCSDGVLVTFLGNKPYLKV